MLMNIFVGLENISSVSYCVLRPLQDTDRSGSIGFPGIDLIYCAESYLTKIRTKNLLGCGNTSPIGKVSSDISTEISPDPLRGAN